MSTRPVAKKRTKQSAETVDGDDTVRISVLLSREQRLRLKVMAAERGITISEVVREGIARFLRSDS